MHSPNADNTSQDDRQFSDMFAAHYQALYDSAPVGYVVVNKLQRIVEANAAFLQLLGGTFQDVLAQPFAVFVVGDDLALYEQHITAVQQQMAHKCLVRLQLFTGFKCLVQLQTVMLDIDSEERFLIAVIDMEHQPAVVEVTAPVEALSFKEISTQAAQIAHDLNNKLMIINTSAELINLLMDEQAVTNDSADVDEVRRRLQLILSTAQESASTLSQLAQMARTLKAQ